MKVIVTNNHGDPVYRLGIEFPPHDKKEINLDNPDHLRLLNACRALTTEIKPAAKKEK